MCKSQISCPSFHFAVIKTLGKLILGFLPGVIVNLSDINAVCHLSVSTAVAKWLSDTSASLPASSQWGNSYC
jgi:hypothetical protein